ncbi:MAG: pirin family protein [Alphaproteobacteria bacterium]
MITIRHAEDRGTANLGWLNSKHSFSFGHFHDPAHMGFGALRVINEDRVQPGEGFPTHGHENMEIISYVLDGALEHKDSIGTGSVIRPGEVQRMSAGTGIRHSEFNASDRDIVHFLQIWVIPNKQDIDPGYEQKAFAEDGRRGLLRLVASNDARDGSLKIHQDVDLYTSLLDDGDVIVLPLRPGRQVWVQVARGSVQVNGEQLYPGDGAGLTAEESVTVTGTSDAEVLIFDLAA